MRLHSIVKRRLEQQGDNPEIADLEGALAEAEKLAEQFSDVKPQPYGLHSGQYAGFPLYKNEDTLN